MNDTKGEKVNDSPRRKSLRYKGYDYSQAGAYFITICTHNKVPLFGEITGGEMHLNDLGMIVREEWKRSGIIRREIELGAYVIMPNHFHGIVWIVEGRGDRPVAPTGTSMTPQSFRDHPGPQPRSLGTWVAGFKAAVTTRINAQRGTPGMPVWQRNYWDHIIRDEKSLQTFTEYILTNPARWGEDQFCGDGFPRLE